MSSRARFALLLRQAGARPQLNGVKGGPIENDPDFKEKEYSLQSTADPMYRFKSEAYFGQLIFVVSPRPGWVATFFWLAKILCERNI